MVRFFSLAIIMMLFVACTVTGESMIPPTVTPLVAQVELSAITPVSVQTATQQVTTPTPKATLVPTFTPTPTITTEAIKDNTPTATVDPIESVKLPDECYEDLSKVESFDEFQPCSIFQYSPDQRFLGFFYGPEYCMRGIIIFDLEEETTIYKSGIGSGARFEFLTNGKALITTGHCEGAQVDLFDPNTGEIKRLGGAGIGRENTVWNLERTAVAVSTMQYAGFRGAIWGYNVEKDFVFLSQPTTWGIDNHMMWSPDGSHILYQHRKLGDGLASWSSPTASTREDLGFRVTIPWVEGARRTVKWLEENSSSKKVKISPYTIRSLTHGGRQLEI